MMTLLRFIERRAARPKQRAFTVPTQRFFARSYRPMVCRGMTCSFGRLCLLAWLSLTLSYDARKGFAQNDAQLPDRAIKILQSRCFRCHGGSSTSAGLNVLSATNLLQRRGQEETATAMVVPGNSAKSLLFQAISTGYMPLDDSEESIAMTDAEKETIKQWIDAGATFPVRKINQVINLETAYRAALQFLDQQPKERQGQIRFLSLSHLHNNEEVSAQELRYTRAAIVKVVNSLAFKRSTPIELLEVPGTEASVLALDLRDLEWDRNRNWQLVLDHYPYGVQFEFSQQRGLRSAYNELRQKTGTDQPIIRADWFVIQASQHPLYTALLELPPSLNDLQSRLGVNFIQNIEDGKVMRAGFARSGVSQQNRLVERHEGQNGYVWLSYDFKPRRAKGDLARFPLGPQYPSNAFPKQAFVHDGGELIFRLPNGLQGYMLVLGDGKRLDGPAPADVVFDSSGVTGSSAILNGISCMNCHAHGMIAGFRDDIRDSHAIGGPAQLLLEKIYADPEALNTVLDADRKSYIEAEQKIIGKYLQPEDVGEPVGKVSLRYISNVNVQTAAFELNMASAKELQTVIANNRNLASLGLGRLTQEPASTIQRAVWESVDGLSFWQEIVTAVQPGAMPIAPRALAVQSPQ